jgi:hypothetical protein
VEGNIRIKASIQERENINQNKMNNGYPLYVLLVKRKRRKKKKKMITKTILKALIILSIIQTIYHIETGLICLALCVTNLIVYNQITKTTKEKP